MEEEVQDAPVESAEVSQEQDNRPEGWEQVEFTPEQQQRFNRVYGQVKTLERDVTEYKTIAQQQYEIIEQLRQGQQQIVSHIVEDKFTAKENQLVAAQKEAFDKGDFDAYNKATRELGKLDLQRENAQKQKPEKQAKQPEYAPPVSGEDAINMAVESGEISRDDASTYRSWANEKDQYGNYVRPWAHGDLRNSAAVYEGQAVFENPAFRDKSFADKLREIDRRMGISRNSSPQVMPAAANLTRSQKTSNIRLSPYQEQIAVKTKFAGPGKSNAEHLEAYRQQVFQVKGSRK